MGSGAEPPGAPAAAMERFIPRPLAAGSLAKKLPEKNFFLRFFSAAS